VPSVEVNATSSSIHRVLAVGKASTGRYQLKTMNGKGPETRDFDLVLVCLPHPGLRLWAGKRALRKSMSSTSLFRSAGALFARLGLFDTPFWATKISAPGSVGSFRRLLRLQRGGAPRRRQARRAELLIPGSDALAFANLSDQD